jgi:GH25 family lysozyme M1 (1,4-beta-N-acetylmuramidase)
MHFLTLVLSGCLGQIATLDSEHGTGAASWARTMHLSAEYPGCENWQRRSQEMMKRGIHDLSRWESRIDGAEVSLSKRNGRAKNGQKQTKTNKSKRTKNKQKQKKKSKQKKQKQSKAEAKSKQD